MDAIWWLLLAWPVVAVLVALGYIFGFTSGSNHSTGPHNVRVTDYRNLVVMDSGKLVDAGIESTSSQGMRPENFPSGAAQEIQAYNLHNSTTGNAWIRGLDGKRYPARSVWEMLGGRDDG